MRSVAYDYNSRRTAKKGKERLTQWQQKQQRRVYRKEGVSGAHGDD